VRCVRISQSHHRGIGPGAFAVNDVPSEAVFPLDPAIASETHNNPCRISVAAYIPRKMQAPEMVFALIHACAHFRGLGARRNVNLKLKLTNTDHQTFDYQNYDVRTHHTNPPHQPTTPTWTLATTLSPKTSGGRRS
jgi:hypothetical protein